MFAAIFLPLLCVALVVVTGDIVVEEVVVTGDTVGEEVVED